MTVPIKGGRPLKFETPEILEQAINNYFDKTPLEKWTITGLALALDTDRITICNYGRKDEYSNSIKRARLKVENAYELSLREKGRTGDIFALKNFGWKDQGNVDITSDGEKLDSGMTALLATADKIASKISGKQIDE